MWECLQGETLPWRGGPQAFSEGPLSTVDLLTACGFRLQSSATLLLLHPASPPRQPHGTHSGLALGSVPGSFSEKRLMVPPYPPQSTLLDIGFS